MKFKLNDDILVMGKYHGIIVLIDPDPEEEYQYLVSFEERPPFLNKPISNENILEDIEFVKGENNDWEWVDAIEDYPNLDWIHTENIELSRIKRLDLI